MPVTRTFALCEASHHTALAKTLVFASDNSHLPQLTNGGRAGHTRVRKAASRYPQHRDLRLATILALGTTNLALAVETSVLALCEASHLTGLAKTLLFANDEYQLPKLTDSG
jgi:hypothetical protein